MKGVIKKECAKCGVIKTKENTNMKGVYFSTYCKKCTAIVNKEYRESKKGKLVAKKRKLAKKKLTDDLIYC